MKESITKFDLEAAFKALDDLETPVAEKGIRANKPALNEIFSRKSKFDALFEEYYDIGSTDELSEAQEAREAEVAKAKLARIEKIVDLDADSPDDLLTSYVGKYIIQCPQCMTLFYKDQEDVVTSEDDESVVNINEVCQHCGNESGYTLIGKVGEAEEELPAEDATEDDLDLSAEGAESGEEDAEGGDENVDDTEGAEGGEDEDLDLAAIDFGEEDEEAEETKEESFANTADGSPLLEQLNEETEDGEADELDISDSEFKELLASSEFAAPVSDKAAKAMLDNLDEAAIPCEELEEALADDDTLNEASFFKNLGKLGKAAIKGTKKTANKANNAFGELADKALDKSMTREEKADWVMTHTLKPEVEEVEIDNDGDVIPDESNQKYTNYAVVCYKGYYSNGKTITMSPSFNNKNLVIALEAPEFRETYTEAEELSKGWSQKQKGGPAFIYMVNGKDLSKAAYLCQFFKGELDTKQDKLETYFGLAKKDLEGKAHITKGGGIKGDSGPRTEERAISEVKVGDKLLLGKDAAIVTAAGKSKYNPSMIALTLKDVDGDVETLSFEAAQKVTVILDGADESLNPSALSTIMEQVEEINDGALESLITNSLIADYKNVAGFRLADCSYLNEELKINGKVFFESGNVRDITYTFTEATTEGENTVLHGLNEKLGADKAFKLVGKTDNNKVFMAEAFTQNKKD